MVDEFPDFVGLTLLSLIVDDKDLCVGVYVVQLEFVLNDLLR